MGRSPQAELARPLAKVSRHFLSRVGVAISLVGAVALLSSCTSLRAGSVDTGATGPSSSASSQPGSETETDDSSGSPSSNVTPLPSVAHPAVVPAGLESFYQQKAEWKPCKVNSSMDCAIIEVPLNYAKPGTETIQLAIVKAPATGGKPLSSLVINPGGPGGPGVSLLESALKLVVSNSIARNYDVVSFDPRGVGQSTAVKCFDSTKDKDAFLELSNDPNTDTGYQAQVKAQIQLAQKCKQGSGNILPFIDTVSSAKDMDVLRAVLGERQLSYLGFSYGTLLGATYAANFPNNVGRFVLDGAVDPSLNADKLSHGQALGFEAVLSGYLESCLNRAGCPFKGTIDEASASIKAKIAALATKPLATKDPNRKVTQSIALGAVLNPLYREQYWQLVLDPVMVALQKGDGDSILYWSDILNSRTKDGYEDNSSEAFTAINCADDQLKDSLSVMRADAAQMAKAAPLFGRYFGYGSLSCQGWSTTGSGPAKALDVKGVPPMIIIGSTGDPATPYPWSVALQQQIKDSVLLTSQSWGHTAYPGASDCIADTVNDYLLRGKVPDLGKTCDGHGPSKSVVPENYEEKYFGK